MVTINPASQIYVNNADGFTLGGGTTERDLIVTGANITLTGSGTNAYTFPASADTLVGRASTDTLTNKTITSGTYSGTSVFTGKINTYNNIATVGQGVPSIYGIGRATAQVAANASVATYTVGAADGSFIISANVLVTASVTNSFTVTCTYTDEGNTSRTLTLNFSQLTGTFLTAITNVQGVGAYEGIPLHIRCKASTSITIASTGTFTSVTYNIEGAITQIA